LFALVVKEVKQRKIGTESVGEIGLGCMGMSWGYGQSNDAESLRVLNRSLELGVNFWDTADLYGAGKNEELLAQALKNHREQVFLATKFGNVYDRTMTAHQDLVEQGDTWIVDGTPDYVRQCCDRSLQRLGVDQIDLYYQHRVDPRTPIEETVGAMAQLVKAGKVRFLGLSEPAADTIRRAHKVHPITAVQTEYSLWTRHVEEAVLPTCRELGIAFVPYSPLGRGFLTGEIKSSGDLDEGDLRRNHPRFKEENLMQNLSLVDQVKAVAERKGVTPAQVALAWVLSQGDEIIPIPGTKHVKYLEQNAAAAEVQLTQRDMDDLSNIPHAVGDRYPQVGAKFLNG
jgi:aryl-alcohol dehydrogenase-like predicted oxidoreductase